jgi:hypothetical protein
VVEAPAHSTPLAAKSRRQRRDANTTFHELAVLDSRRLAFGLIAVFLLVFTIQAWPRIEAPFGDSHDGENAAVWGLSSRGIRTDGFFESRGGARLADDGGLYAHHPPLIAAETALIETVFGEHPWSTRAPAWLGSMFSVVLLFWLLREHGIRRVPGAIAVVVGLGSPMFFLYGSMLDTLQIGLPFALGLLVARKRAERVPTQAAWVTALLAALTVVSSWQGALLVTVLAGGDLVRWRRRTTGSRAPSPVQWGLAAGVALVAAWLWWAVGSFGPIFDQLHARSGGSSRSLGWSDYFEFQGLYLGALLSPILIIAGIPALVLATLDQRWRELVLVTLTVAVVYSLALRDGATNHDYWNYWLLVPLTIGIAVLCERGAAALAARSRSGPTALISGLALAAVALVSAFPTSTPANDQYNNGLEAIRVLDHAIDRSQPIAFVGHYQNETRWIRYAGLTPRRLQDQTDVSRVARNEPDTSVVVKCLRRRSWLDAACASGSPYVLVSITRLDDSAEDKFKTQAA